jgi:hypothetical protein
MRADMGKVLVERPRVGHSDPGRKKGYRKAAAKALDSGGGPTREGMKARTPRSKHFNEHLGPLRRFLDANVGRPWDKVHAEIREHVDPGNMVQKHVLTHLFDYVVTQVEEIDGDPFDARPRWGLLGRGGRNLLTDGDAHTWFVCPRTGLLRKSRRVPPEQRKRPPPLRRVWLGPTDLCVTIGGRWERLTLVRIADEGPPREGYDVVFRRRVNPGVYWPWQELYGVRAFATARRQPSRAEQKRLPIPIDWVK